MSTLPLSGGKSHFSSVVPLFSENVTLFYAFFYRAMYVFVLFCSFLKVAYTRVALLGPGQITVADSGGDKKY